MILELLLCEAFTREGDLLYCLNIILLHRSRMLLSALESRFDRWLLAGWRSSSWLGLSSQRQRLARCALSSASVWLDAGLLPKPSHCLQDADLTAQLYEAVAQPVSRSLQKDFILSGPVVSNVSQGLTRITSLLWILPVLETGLCK